ncbi:YncE family protein [Mycolicibacterium sp. 120270]|uniref:YncE family protein n=1 Tax=Mycolicibacterium sp. 120270 TaxID=3090600 RepID=UPI00299D4C33|nr:YncE family protein [Mycolicibacterium sp. 120270]MDX1887367.1 YncE family protein [Mycolicibacterium sp. 120270]
MHKNTVPGDPTAAAVIEPAVVLGSIDVERGPIADLAVTSDGTTIVATHYGDGNVSIIDAYALTVDADIEMPGVEPSRVTAAERRAYVTVAGHKYDSVAVIDTANKQVVANHPIDDVASDVAVSPDGTRIYVGRTGDDVGLTVINTFGRTHNVALADGVGRTVDAVRVSPNGRLVYVATSDAVSGTLHVVDAAKGRVLREVSIASPIRDVALSYDGALAYVASFDAHWGGSVDVIDTAINEITAKVGIGGAPMQMALSADGARLYIADYEHVAVLCTETNSVIDMLTVTAKPSCVAVSPDSTRLYIADHAGVITAMSVAADASEVETEKLISLHVSDAPDLRALQPAGI